MKRIVCALDGTWNNDDGATPLTNVAKLTRAIPFVDAAGVRQLVRYVVGIASSEDESLPFLKGGLGVEVSERIKAGYQFLSNIYEPGDEIYLFGFSHGAYEARSLASFITLFGLARRSANFDLNKAWAIYRQPERKRDFDAVAEASAQCHYPVRIRCLGLWDTVGNIGNPVWPWGWLRRKLDYHDTRLHDTIDVALHALSIDEARSSFRPSLFTYPAGVQPSSRQHIEQVWFPGSHADVGGGWPDCELSDIALLWMAERVRATTTLAIDIEKLKRESAPNHLGLQHASSTGLLYTLNRIKPFVRLIEQSLENAAPARRRRSSKLRRGLVSLNEQVHESALQRMGQTVKEARGRRVRDIIYEPATLIAKKASSAAIEEPAAIAEPAENKAA